MTAFVWIFLCDGVVLSILRIVVELLLVDPRTGFYTGLRWLVITQDIVYVAALLLPIPFVWRQKRLTLISSNRQALLSVPLVAAGVALAAYSAYSLAGDTVRFTMGTNNDFVGLLVCALAVLAGISLVVMGSGVIFKGFHKTGLWMAALPALWLAADAAASYLRYPTIANISDQKLEVVALCAGALFFVAHARVVAREDVHKNPHAAKLLGMAFALLSCSVSLGQLAAAAAGQSAVSHMPPARMLIMLTLGLYAGAWSCSVREY